MAGGGTLGGCGGDEGAAATATTGVGGETGGEVDLYMIRGRVEQLPVAGDHRTAFMVHHEAIPTFRDLGTGEVVGMGSMAMPFQLAEGVDGGDLAVGDLVEITVAAPRKDAAGLRVTAVRRLPAGTVLELGEGG